MGQPEDFKVPLLLAVLRDYFSVKLPKNFVPFPVISREQKKPDRQRILWKNLFLYPSRLVFY